MVGEEKDAVAEAICGCLGSLPIAVLESHQIGLSKCPGHKIYHHEAEAFFCGHMGLQVCGMLQRGDTEPRVSAGMNQHSINPLS